MPSPFRAVRRHRGRMGISALTIGLVASLASAALIVSGPAPAGADHDPDEPTAEIHITKIAYGAAPGAAGTFTTGDGPGDPIPGFPASIDDGDTVSFEVAPGTYDITETNVIAPSPHIFCAGRDNLPVLWSVSGAVLTLTPTAGSVTACVFTNSLPSNGPVPGEINFIKIVEDDPGFGQEFSFFFQTGEQPNPFVPVPDLAHGDTARVDTTFDQLLPSGYIVGEIQGVARYPYVLLTCGGNFAGFQGAGFTIIGPNFSAGILAPGNSQFATCIFINRFDPFVPSVEIVKSGPAAARAGDVIDYTFTITNTSTDGDFYDAPIPDLAFDSITDPQLPGLTVPADCLQLATGASCEFTAPYAVLDTDTDPLTNEVDIAYRPVGFPDLVAGDSDDHSVTILPPEGDLTVVVVGGDPDFELTGPVNETFTLDADGASVTFEDIPAGEYTLDLTALEPGLVLDAIDCDPEETSVDLVAGTVVFDVADGPVTCTYTLSAEADDDDYDQYPGDDDFDFEPPFTDDDDDDDEAPAVVAGDNQNNPNGSGSNDPGLGAAGDPGVPAPAGDVTPQAADQLPRTGGGLTRLGLMGGLLMILVGAAALLGARRRETTRG